MRFSRTLAALVLLLPITAAAAIVGRAGKVYPFAEEDFVTYMKRRSQEALANGEIDRKREAVEARVRKAFFDPDPVAGIAPAGEERVYHVDPGIVLEEDIRDHQGKLVVAAGTYVNPLDRVQLDRALLFFDASDARQRAIAKEIIAKRGKLRVTAILVAGAPAPLEREWDMPIYFDQGGHLSKRLNLTQTPAVVTQDERRLRVHVLAVH